MYANIELDMEEINPNFLDNLKKTFKGKKLNLIISDIDETDYLLSDELNKEILLKRINDIENDQNIVNFSLNNE